MPRIGRILKLAAAGARRRAVRLGGGGPRDARGQAPQGCAQTVPPARLTRHIAVARIGPLGTLTRRVLRFRWVVLACGSWSSSLGGAAASGLSDLLTNRFTLPGTDADRAETILQRSLRAALDGRVHARRPRRRARGAARAAGARGRRCAPSSECRRAASPRSRRSSAHVVVAQRSSRPRPGRRQGPHRRDARGDRDRFPARRTGSPARRRSSTTSTPSSPSDLQKSASSTSRSRSRSAAPDLHLRHARVPAAAIFALLHDPGDARDRLDLRQLHGAVDLPAEHGLADRARDRGRLLAPRSSIATARNCSSSDSKEDAIVRTMATAGRAVVFSGTAVAIGLALLLFMPLPFMRGFGVGGLMIPLVSRARGRHAAAGAPLTIVGERARPGAPRAEARARAARRARGRLLAALARTIMRRPVLFARVPSALLIALRAAGPRAPARAGLEPRASRRGSRRCRGSTSSARRSGPARRPRRTSSSTRARPGASGDAEIQAAVAG